jgi:hypothetical protein
MDELFGVECFGNEIVWHYYSKRQGIPWGRFADQIMTPSSGTRRALTSRFNRIRELQ